MVALMTPNRCTQPVTSSTACRCGHLVDDHNVVLVITDPYPAGVVVCPAGCPCTSTWRANTGPSTPEQITEARTLIREALLAAGVPLPEVLR